MPKMIRINTDVPDPFSSIASGTRWINASPNRLPAEKLTR
jgi:hypothetical protein